MTKNTDVHIGSREPSIPGINWASRLIIWITKHWLAFFNVMWGLYIFLPVLAPILINLGYPTPARYIYGFYSFACHQLPDHSYLLFGDSLIPNLRQLEAGGMPAGLGLLDQRTFIGNESLGYKVAICQRDMAIYGSVFLGGLLFGLVGRRAKPIDWRLYLILLIPMAIDGGSQLFGLRESNWILRSLTGSLFGMASVWFAYPHVEQAMRDVREDELARSS